MTDSGIGEGVLSMLKCINVDNEPLARAYINHRLDKYLYHQIPNFIARVTQFQQEVNQCPMYSNGRIYCFKFLADMMDALVGTV